MPACPDGLASGAKASGVGPASFREGSCPQGRVYSRLMNTRACQLKHGSGSGCENSRPRTLRHGAKASCA
jgi:hypothetical protein